MALFDFEKHQANKILKGFIDDDIEKAKAVPVGTVMTRKSGLVERKTATGWETVKKTHPDHPSNKQTESHNKKISEGDFFIHHYSSGPPSKVKVEKIEGDRVLIAEPLSMSGNSYTTKNNIYLPLSDVIAKVNEFKAKDSKPNNVSSKGKEVTQSAPKSSSEQSKETKESKSNLEYALKTVNSIKEKLAKIYVPTHKSYQVLSDAVDKFKKSANILIDKNPNIEFRFGIDEGWYDKNEHCSVSFDVSLYKPFLIEKNRAEYDEQRKKYKYGFSVDSFVAQKLKEFCAESGVNLRGGESGYSTNNSGAVYLPITSCEL